MNSLRNSLLMFCVLLLGAHAACFHKIKNSHELSTQLTELTAIEQRALKRLNLETCSRLKATSDPFFMLFAAEINPAHLEDLEINHTFSLPHEDLLREKILEVRKFKLGTEYERTHLSIQAWQLFLALEDHPEMNARSKEQLVKLFERNPNLEALFIDALSAVTDLDFFANSMLDLLLIQRLTSLSFDKILSKYEGQNGFTHLPKRLPDLPIEKFIEVIQKPTVWGEGYLENGTATVEEIGSRLRATELNPENFRDHFMISLSVSRHGVYSHRIQNYIQLRHRDACNAQRGVNLDFRDFRSILKSETLFARFWRSLFDDAMPGVVFSNPHLVNLMSHFLNEGLGKFVDLGTQPQKPDTQMRVP